MRKNVKNDSVIRAITLGIAGMMTLTATVGAFPMQVQASETTGDDSNANTNTLQGNGTTTTETSTGVITETTTKTENGNTTETTTTTTVTPDAAGREDIVDGDGHQISVEVKQADELYVVTNGGKTEEATKDSSVATGKVEDYTEVVTTVDVETKHVVVTETTNEDGTTTTENVTGVTADGTEITEIVVAGEDVTPEQVNIITKEETVTTGEGEEAITETIVEVEDDELVYGYFDENGLFQEDAEKNNEKTKAYVVDVDGTYQETTTNVTTFETKDGKIAYLTDEYEADKLTVDVVHTVTGTDGKEHIVAVTDNKEAGYEEVALTVEVIGKDEDVKSTETYQYVNVLERGEVAAYKVKKVVRYEGIFNIPVYEWVPVSKEEYDRTNTPLKQIEYNYTEKEIEVGDDPVYATHQWGEEPGYRTVDINGTKYYVEDNHHEWCQKVDVQTGSREVTTTVTKYYAKDAEKNEFEVSSNQVTTVTKYNLEYDGKTFAEDLTLEQKNAIVASIDSHKYVAVNQNKYAIEIPDEENPGNTKKIYLDTDQVSVLTTHDVKFTETTTHYYVDKLKEQTVNSKNAFGDKQGLVINGEEYLVEVSFKESTYVKPVINKTQFSYIEENGQIIGVKVVIDYTVNGVTQTYSENIYLQEYSSYDEDNIFSASNIAKLTVTPKPVLIESGVSGYTFVTEKTTKDMEVTTTETVPGSEGTKEVDAGTINSEPKASERERINHVDVRVDANVVVDNEALQASVSDIKIVYNGVERTSSNFRQESRNVWENHFDTNYSNDKPVTINATVTYEKDGKSHSFVYSVTVYMKYDNYTNNVCKQAGHGGFDFVISATDIKSAIDAYERETTTTKTVVISSDKTSYEVTDTKTSGGELNSDVTQKNLIVKTYVRKDLDEQVENGNTHYPTGEYTEALSEYALKYSSRGYKVFGTLDEEGNLTIYSDKPGDYETQEDAIYKYLSQTNADELAALAKEYPTRDKVATAVAKQVSDIVDAKVAELKAAVIAAHPEWDRDEIVWSLSEEDIEKIKKDAIDSVRVHWYVLKYEADNYHIDGVMLFEGITLELNGEVIVVPPTVIPTPDPIPTPTPDPDPTPDTTPDTVITTVLGANRAVEATETVAPAEEGTVLGARRAEGSSVLGASRTKAVLGARRGAQTGDVSGIAGSVSALFASAFAGIGYVVSRRKKKEDDK